MGICQMQPIPTLCGQNTSRDAQPCPSVPRPDADASVGEPHARPAADDAAEIGDLLSTAISSVGFDPQSIAQSLADRGHRAADPVDGRLVAAAAVLAIVIFVIDWILQWV